MKGKRILLAEDEILSSFSLKRQLEAMGHCVIGTPARGEDAVNLAIRDKPDLVVMDINLAGAIDGIEAARRIKEATGAPLVFLTGYSDEAIRVRALVLEPLGFILKPIDGEGLRRVIAAALEACGEGGSGRR